MGVQGWAVSQQRRVACMAGSLGVHALSGNLQPNLDAEGRFGFSLVFELFLHLAVPGGLSVKREIAKDGLEGLIR